MKACDIYVLIIGGRYGSEVSETRASTPKSFFDRYESVTKMEYKAALDEDVPIYILIERAVYAEYQTFLKNRENKKVTYAHVDSVNVFHFVESILIQPRNNPLQTFDKYVDIEGWLRLQWAGLFREMLRRRSSHQQLTSLAGQVQELAEVNKTLRRYLEEVVTKLAPDKEANKLIQAEGARLQQASVTNLLKRNDYVNYLLKHDVPFEAIRDALERAETLDAFLEIIKRYERVSPGMLSRASVAQSSLVALRDLNDAREILGKKRFITPENEIADHSSVPEHKPHRTSRRKQ